MSRNIIDNGQEPGLGRRRFLQYFAAMGVSGAVAPTCFGAQESDGAISIDTIKAAEKIADIELTDQEREEVLEGLRDNLKKYRNLRSREMDDAVNPSMVFNPIPPGKTFSQEQRPFRTSRIELETIKTVEDAAYLSVLQLAELIRAKQITSTDLTKMYIARLKRYDPMLHFVVNLTEELALRQARKADEEIKADCYRGPLHGIPYGLKDLFSVQGYPTTWGAEPFKNRIIDRDASVAQKLEEAGAVLVAKLSTGVFASGDRWYGGLTRNPWNPRRGSGGSSAGPAAATAAGCVGFAIGTETNGSMVSPCDTCGVTGLRPTFGRISRYGCMTVSWSFDKVTPICRAVEDAAVILEAIRGPDGKDNSIIDLPFNWDPGLDLRKLRIGYHTRHFNEELMGNPSGASMIYYRKAVRRESKRVLDFLEKKDVKLVPLDFKIPHADEGFPMLVEAAAANDAFTRGNIDDLVQDQKWPRYYRTHRFVPAVEYINACRYRSVIIQAMDEALKDVDVYVEITWSNNWTTNVTGHPIVVVPCGFVAMNRPVSVTFVGKLFGEAEMLAVAKAFQDGTRHHLRYPRL